MLPSRNSAAARRWCPVWWGALFYFLFWGGLATYGPFLNVYYTQLGFTRLQIGLLGALLPLMRLSTGPLLSGLADKRGIRKQMLAFAIAFVGLGILLLRSAETFASVLPWALVLSLAFSSTTPLADSMIAQMAVHYRVDYGKLRVWGSLSFALVSIACGALWERVGFGAMFLVAAVSFVPVLFVTRFLEEPVTVEQRGRPSLRMLALDRGLRALFAANFLIGMGEGLYATFSGVYMDQLGGSKLLVGGLFGLSALCELPTMALSGALARRIGKPVVLGASYAIMGVAFLGYAIARTPEILLLFGMLKGVGYGFYFSMTISLANERAPEAWTSTVQSLLMGLGLGLAPLLTLPLVGWLSDVLGMARIFGVAGAVELLATLVLGWAWVRREFDESPLNCL